jgi:hypothetical protein
MQRDGLASDGALDELSPNSRDAGPYSVDADVIDHLLPLAELQLDEILQLLAMQHSKPAQSWDAAKQPLRCADLRSRSCRIWSESHWR